MRVILTFAACAFFCSAGYAQDNRSTEMFNHNSSPSSSPPSSPPPKTGREIGHQFLDKLRSSPKPTEQNDLNTVGLASARRERAVSMEERTNGLWQSWLVSICQGCGADQQPFTDKEGYKYVERVRAQQSAEPASNQRYVYYPGNATRQVRPENMAANLSTEVVGQIRRDPNR